MKRLFCILTAATVALSFSACDLHEEERDTDNEILRPDDDKPIKGEENDDIDRSNYQIYNHTFTQGQAGYYGQYYEEQPSTSANWFLELADNNYDLENYEGSGYNIALELFAAGTNPSSLPVGKYTVEAFNDNMFSDKSIMYSWIGEDENGEEVPAGSWLFQSNEGIAGATAGYVNISASGSSYTIQYELHDDEYQITFKGTFSGSLTIYDGTESASYVSAAKASKAHRADKQVKRYRVRR